MDDIVLFTEAAQLGYDQAGANAPGDGGAGQADAEQCEWPGNRNTKNKIIIVNNSK